MTLPWCCFLVWAWQVHVVDGSGPQAVHELEAITAELQLFSALASKPRVVVFNKMDLPEAQGPLAALPRSSAAGAGRRGRGRAVHERGHRRGRVGGGGGRGQAPGGHKGGREPRTGRW